MLYVYFLLGYFKDLKLKVKFIKFAINFVGFWAYFSNLFVKISMNIYIEVCVVYVQFH